MKSTPLNISSYTALLLSLCGFCFSLSAAAETCEPQPGNEYEKIFCQLKRGGRGASLPNIYQFRENTPITQALLLKKPAERAGITIIIPERNDQETLRRQEDLLLAPNEGPRPLDKSVRTIAILQQAPVAPPPPAPALPVTESVKTESIKTEAVKAELAKTVELEQTAALEQKQNTAVAAATPVLETPALETSALVSSPLETAGLENCVLQQLVLQCVDGEYRLVGNKTNQQLADTALADDHKLALPVYSGAANDTAAQETYLVSAYSRYLAGMMEIGLGASTMSYGKFVNLHTYITDQGLDFVGRFETMYQFLKKDKQSIGVSTKLSIAEGLAVRDCGNLDDLIVCDYQKTNYIFAKAD